MGGNLGLMVLAHNILMPVLGLGAVGEGLKELDGELIRDPPPGVDESMGAGISFVALTFK